MFVHHIRDRRNRTRRHNKWLSVDQPAHKKTMHVCEVRPCMLLTTLLSDHSSTNKITIAYWVAFGPHGARTPLTGPGHALKVAAGTTAVVGAAGALFLWIRSKGTYSCS